jgi:hypothetical protein
MDYTPSSSSSTPIELPLDFGDLINDHDILSVSGKKYPVVKDNSHFKCLYIIQLGKSKAIDIRLLTEFVEISKSFSKDKISFYFLAQGEINSNVKTEMIKFQEKYDICIAETTIEFLFDNYKIPSCGCGFILVLDRDNKVRYANTPMNKSTTISMIERELERVVNDKKEKQ